MTDRGAFLFGWLQNLTGGPDEGGVHYIDVSNASRTLLCTLATVSWSPSLLAWFNFKESMLPEIRSSSEVYGNCFEGPLEGVPISGAAGDQQAALVGQKCLTVGMAKATFGTVRLPPPPLPTFSPPSFLFSFETE